MEQVIEAVKPTPPKEILRGLKRADFFNGCQEIAGKQILKSSQFKQHLEVYGDQHRQIAEDAVTIQLFKGIDDPNEHDSLLGLSGKKQAFARALALECLENPEFDLGLSEGEKIIIEGALKIAPHMDEVYKKWRSTMVTSAFGQELEEMGPAEVEKMLTAAGLKNPHTILIKNEKGNLQQIPYSEAFSQEYSAIGDLLSQTIKRLAEITAENALDKTAYIEYLSAYREALLETNPDKLKEVWKKVDEIWLETKGKLQIVHGMENYDDPGRIRIVPELRVLIEDESADETLKQAETVKQALIDDLSEDCRDLDSFQASLPAIKNSQIYSTQTIVISGCVLDSKVAGQVVPNDEDIRAEKGVKVFVVRDSLDLRHQKIKKGLAAVFGEDFANNEYVDPGNVISSILVAGHEFTHPAFIRPGERREEGVFSQVEEVKAEIGSIITFQKQFNKGELSRNQVKRGITSVIGGSLRTLLAKGEADALEYYNIGLFYIDTLIKSGMMKETSEGWTIDFSEESITSFFAEIKRRFKELAVAYETRDPEKVARFTTNYLQETDASEALVKIINANM